jgi:hypothetical protein
VFVNPVTSLLMYLGNLNNNINLTYASFQVSFVENINSLLAILFKFKSY